jgi:hypothetical protein
MNAIGHTRVRFKRTCVGSNGILECKFLPKTRTVPIAMVSRPQDVGGFQLCDVISAATEFMVRPQDASGFQLCKQETGGIIQRGQRSDVSNEVYGWKVLACCVRQQRRQVFHFHFHCHATIDIE